MALMAGFVFQCVPAWAKISATGTFVSVSGIVKIKQQNGGNTLLAKVGSVVKQGERVVTDKDSTAVLQFFDGSQLTVKPQTDFWLSKLKAPSSHDKILKFKMMLGSLLAQVTKLNSSNSSFEVEAGGVVCGVRGTKFGMTYNPAAQKVTVNVTDGTVWCANGKHIQIFTAGEGGIFLNGHFIPPGPPNKPGENESLDDFNTQFLNTVLVNHDNTFTDPSIGGDGSLRVTVNVPGREGVN
jgi:hypothetical protein